MFDFKYFFEICDAGDVFEKDDHLYLDSTDGIKTAKGN